MTSDDVREIVRLYESVHSIREIAEITGWSYGSVRNALVDKRVPLRPQGRYRHDLRERMDTVNEPNRVQATTNPITHAPDTIWINEAAPRPVQDRLADELEGIGARLLGIANELRVLR